jgi:hypothetical protein
MSVIRVRVVGSSQTRLRRLAIVRYDGSPVEEPSFGADSGVSGNPTFCRGGTNLAGRAVETVWEMIARCADVHERGVEKGLRMACRL